MAEHAIELDHNIDSLNAGKLKMVRDAYKLDGWESLFITIDEQRRAADNISLFGLAELNIVRR